MSEDKNKPVAVPRTIGTPGNFAQIKWNSCCFQHRAALNSAGVVWAEMPPEVWDEVAVADQVNKGSTQVAFRLSDDEREAVEFCAGLLPQLANRDRAAILIGLLARTGGDA